MDRAQGYVLAGGREEAVALIGDAEVNVCPLPADAVRPGDPGEAVWRA